MRTLQFTLALCLVLADRAVAQSDFGDAPAPYATLLASNGARHLMAPSLHLGTSVDAEPDGQPTAGATGDDDNGIDDEDGVVFAGPLYVGMTVDIGVEATSDDPACIDAWIDFDGDGVWEDPQERIATAESVPGGGPMMVLLEFVVPATATPGTTYARFRLSSLGVSSPLGAAPDGEVEDYAVEIVALDFGDAPPPYPVGLYVGGAAHAVNPAVVLGTSIDAEINGLSSANADGDDLDGIDDEDGVVFTTPMVPGAVGWVEVTASVAGYVSAWVDWDGNRNWDPYDVTITASVVPGVNALSYLIPPTAVLGTTYARFRYSTQAIPLVGGYLPDGEVEDYEVTIVAASRYDLGDAPDPTYPTLLASSGPRHLLGGSVYLGSAVDEEADGQQNADATGDDADGTDDDDGVVLGSQLLRGLTASVTVTANAAGLLDAWLDLNADGDWDDAGEQVFTDEALAAGANGLTVDIPLTATCGVTFARFRVSTAGGLAPTGEASDGEVEDYQVTIADPEMDLGDAPDPSYPTLLASDGARHVLTGAVWLGEQVDMDTDGQPDAAATGDDNDGSDDDDGVTFTSALTPNSTALIDVEASQAGFLNAWLDLNADGDWDDAGEQVLTDETTVNGTNHFSFAIPATASEGVTFMRCRFSSVAGLGPTGFAVDGEVEDYRVSIETPVSVRLTRRAPTVTTLYPLRRDAGTGLVHVGFYNVTAGHVKLLVQTLAGEVVSTVADRSLGVGYHEYAVRETCLSSGVYVVRLVAPERTIARRVMVAPGQ